jgi:vitamin B12 transporter
VFKSRFIAGVSRPAGSWKSNQEAVMRAYSFLLLALFILGAAGAGPGKADDAEIIVVTATRTPEPISRTGESISVVTADQLAQQQILSVGDALEETPGVIVTRNGGIGQNATVSIRGAEVGQSLILIDGVRINDESSVDDEGLLGDLLVNNIARIEILRGPQSTLYGSDAIGGVVNIITQRGGDSPFALHASAQAGSFDTYQMNAAANGTTGSVDYGSAVNFFHTNGISAADSRNGNPETDGYTNLGLTENVRVKLSDTLSLDLRSYYTNARDDFDDNFLFVPPFTVADSQAYGRNTLLAGYAGLNLDLLGGMFHNRLAIMASDSNRAFYDSAFDTIHKNESFGGRTERLEYQGTFDFSPDDQLTFGAEYQQIESDEKDFSSFAPEAVTKGHSHIASGYAQYLKTFFDQLTLSGGIRYDDDREFGSHLSVKAAAAWSLNGDATVLHANYGNGFKAPTLYEQFSQYSNPLHALAPETAQGWEAGATQKLFGERAQAQLTYFDRHTDDQIDFFVPDCSITPLPPICLIRPFGYYDNIKRTHAHGFEFEASSHITDELSLTASATDMIASDLATHLDLARRPHWTASAAANWTHEDWSAGASLVYVGRRFDSAGEFNPLGAYTLFNLYGSHRLTDSLELFGRIENLFDARYEPVFGYGAPGRAAYGGIRATL